MTSHLSSSLVISDPKFDNETINNEVVCSLGATADTSKEIKSARAAIGETSNAEAVNSGSRTAGTKGLGILDTEASHTEAVDSKNENAMIKDSESVNWEANNIESGDEAGKQLRSEGIRQPKAESEEPRIRRGGSTEKAEKQDENVAIGEKQRNEDSLVEDDGGIRETIDPFEIPQELQTCIKAIKNNNTFTTCGNFSTAPNPVISVQDIGIIGLPLSSRDATAIIAAAAQAPSPHKEKTVIDATPQDTWQLQPNQVQFLNPAWQAWVETKVLVKAANDLGVTDAIDTIKCELDKVLLYKEGGQVLRHKDCDKAPGIFGTLMIVLPSQYSGGILQFSHMGSQKNFDFAGPESLTNTYYAAWYTDILYSASPVTSGYRFALSYNMVYNGSKATPHVPDIAKRMQDLRWVLSTWHRSCADEQSPLILSWMLDHQYPSQALKSQKIEALIGVDKHRGKILLDLAKEQGFELYLAQMDYRKTGTAESGYWDYGCRRYGRWGYDDYSDIDPEDRSMDEVLEESLSAHTFVNCKNGVVLSTDFQPNFDKEDCLPFDYWDDADPDSREYDDNLDYLYHRTAIILWPTETHIDSVDHLTTGFQIAAFLDRALWTQEEIQGGWRLEFGERIIEKLRPSYNGLSRVELQYTDKLMAFALEEKRLDLFLKMIEITKSVDVSKMKEESAGVFGAEGARDIAQRCIANIRGINLQLRMAKETFHEHPEDLKAVMKGLVDAVSITKEVRPEGLREILGLLGPDLFEHCILPNLQKDFSKTSFWVLAWKYYPRSPIMSSSLPEVVRAHEVRFHHTRDKTRYTISSQTLPLFSKVVEIVRGDLAAEIIQKIQALPKPVDAEVGILKGKYPDVLMAITGKIIDILRKHKVPVTIEPYASFIKKTFLKKILPTLGPRPRPGGNLSLSGMLDAGHPVCCSDCNSVDVFLANPWQQTISFHLVQILREHLQYKLRGEKNISIKNSPVLSRIDSRKNTVMGTITFTKVGLSTADVVNRWDKRRATMEREFLAIGDEETRREIFETLSPMIQMGIREYGMGWGKEIEEAVIMGEKEEEEIREKRLQSRARIVAGAIDCYEAAVLPGETRNIRTSLGEGGVNLGDESIQVPNVGRKRKRSLQIIDLTDE